MIGLNTNDTPLASPIEDAGPEVEELYKAELAKLEKQATENLDSLASNTIQLCNLLYAINHPEVLKKEGGAV